MPRGGVEVGYRYTLSLTSALDGMGCHQACRNYIKRRRKTDVRILLYCMIQKCSAVYFKTKLEFIYKILSTSLSSAVSIRNELSSTY